MLSPSFRVITRTWFASLAVGQMLPSWVPPHGPALTVPRSPTSPAFADEARISLLVTALAKSRMYAPADGFPVSVMPPDCAAIVPSARTTAHRALGPAGPGGPAGPAGPLGPGRSWPGLKSRFSSE